MQFIIPLILGLASGGLSLSGFSKVCGFTGHLGCTDMSNYLLPGIIFGIAVLVYLGILRLSFPLSKSLGFIVLSGLGYYIAWLITFSSFSILAFVGGIIGTFIMCLGLLLLGVIKIGQGGRITFFGGLLTCVFFLPQLFNQTVISEHTMLVAFFLIWQSGIMLAIAYFAKKNMQEKI